MDAIIDWGDGSVPEHVTTSDPHTHHYDTDGIYTVSVTGSVTAYNSQSNGGGTSELQKLVSVDNWGQVGFTSMDSAFYYCSNLISVPTSSDGIEAVTNMAGMFGGASSFNSDISGWDTSKVTDMGYMFRHASSFNQDLSEWCVTEITSKPDLFDDGATDWILPNSRPIWKTCPE